MPARRIGAGGIMAGLALLASLLPGLSQTPRFAPVPVAEHRYTGGWEFFVGGGVAVFDCNEDGLPELFAAGGAGPAQLFINTTAAPGAALAFAPAPESDLALDRVTGAYPLDIDSDGRLDLVLLRLGENLALRGLPGCRFARFPAALGFDGGNAWTTAFSATWEGANALPTLAFGNYVDRADPQGPFRACDDNWLLRPKGGRYGAPVVLTPGHCALSALFSDWGRQGRADLRLSNDRHYYVDDGQEQLWAMEPTPRLFTAQDGWKNYRLWGMGIASRDITGDGYPDVFLSSMGDQKLQFFDARAGGPVFVDATYGRGTTAQRPYIGGDGRPSTGWQIAFGDVQNDGRDDVFIAKGNVQEMPGLAMRDPNNLLVQGADGRFTEMGDLAGLADMERGRGAAVEDLNLDGLLDVVVVNRMAPLMVWQNLTEGAGNWLELALRQPAPNSRAIGAWVELKGPNGLQTRELTIGGGHAGGSASWLHFGLGAAERAEIRVIWPDGAASDWLPLAANSRVTLWRDDAAGLRVSRR